MASVKIAGENGEILSEDFVFDPEESCREVMVRIALLISTCSCKFQIFAGKYIVRKGLKAGRLISPGMVLDLRYVDLQDERDRGKKAANFHADGICIRCMKEVGVSAKEIIESKLPMDAARFKEAGFSLKELVFCFEDCDTHPLRIHPPVGKYTLFDSQLKKAGFSAVDFRDAGYHATELSFNHFHREEDMDPGDLDWEECMAFFTAGELKEAGYTFPELIAADFSRDELVEAGFAEDLNKATASVKIARINGDIVVEDFVIGPEESGAALMMRIASLISTCSCKFQIIAGGRKVRKVLKRGDGLVIYLRT